jgi:NitT/TauT family transport system ATP-binding protein
VQCETEIEEEWEVSGAEAVIRVESVSQAFGEEGDPRRVVALESASLDIARGELLCLIGPSGCGKSTLLNIIGGLATPTTGKVTIDGHVVRGPSPQKVAFVFQENTLFPWRTVIDNVKLGMAFQGVAKSERQERALQSLRAVGLADFCDHYPGQLSGGMKQRVQLARALGLKTEILLMDEPFAALDAQLRPVLQDELLELWQADRRTVLFVTHSLEEAILLADRVVVMSARPGKIIDIQTVPFPRPRHADIRTTPEFAELQAKLWALLRSEVEAHLAELGVSAPMGEADA